MKAKLRYLSGFFALVGMAAIAWFNQEQAMTYVFVPISRLSWLLTRTLMVVDQEVYWGGLIFVVVAFGLRFIPARWTRARVLPYSSEIRPEDRATEWERKIREAGEDKDARLSLYKELDELRADLAGAAGMSADVPILPEEKRSARPGSPRQLIRRWAAKLSGRNRTFENEVETSVRSTLEALETLMERRNEPDTRPTNDRG